MCTSSKIFDQVLGYVLLVISALEFQETKDYGQILGTDKDFMAKLNLR